MLRIILVILHTITIPTGMYIIVHGGDTATDLGVHGLIITILVITTVGIITTTLIITVIILTTTLLITTVTTGIMAINILESFIANLKGDAGVQVLLHLGILLPHGVYPNTHMVPLLIRVLRLGVTNLQVEMIQQGSIGQPQQTLKEDRHQTL